MAGRKLTNRQKERIAHIQQQRRERMSARAEQALGDSDEHREQPGLVIIRHGQNLVVEAETGDFIHCLFRQNLGNVVCGDQVIWQQTGDKEGVIVAVQPRVTTLARPDFNGKSKPLAANITQLIVVLAPKPQPTGFLLDQYLVAAELIGVQACITLNKSDLLDEDAWQKFHADFAVYEEIGYPIITVSAKREHGLDPLATRMNEQTSIFVGQSGVGKSSLVNALLSDQKKIQVGRLSDATGLGKHTTSSTTLYHLPTGGDLIDSPGVRSFRLGNLNQQQLETGFREFTPYLGRCKFSNCVHSVEPDCALQAAVQAGEISVERMNHFQRLKDQCVS